MPRPPLLARAGSRIADVCERWFPDAFVFALAAIVLVFVAGLGWGVKPVTLATEFGN
jgi:short-chain fatty acids transporter